MVGFRVGNVMDPYWMFGTRAGAGAAAKGLHDYTI
jgi:hypothetical protein